MLVILGLDTIYCDYLLLSCMSIKQCFIILLYIKHRRIYIYCWFLYSLC